MRASVCASYSERGLRHDLDSHTHLHTQTLARLYREHAGALTARLIRICGGDFGLAEEAVQEAFSAALSQWPSTGAPQNPRAWLARTAQHKAIDRLRRQTRFEAPLAWDDTQPEPAAVSGD